MQRKKFYWKQPLTVIIAMTYIQFMAMFFQERRQKERQKNGLTQQ